MIWEIFKKALDGGELDHQEIADLFNVPLFTPESAGIMAASRKKSERANGGFAEVHAQVGLNIAPCPKNCKFCAFAAGSGVFTEKKEISSEEAVSRAKQFESDGANAIYLMGTADYSWGRFFEISKEVRRALQPETVLIANVGDFDYQKAKQLKDAGFAGIYHAVRLGEGRETGIPADRRLETFEHAREAGLLLGTCLEPVGNEHSVEELVEKTIITREAKPVYSGAARRILIPNTELAAYGMVSEVQMAHILAVVRLAMGYDIPGNCTHEPNVTGASAGANLLWAEAGSNPRDTESETERARGMNVGQCRKIFEESEWKIWEGPSRLYSREPAENLDKKPVPV